MHKTLILRLEAPLISFGAPIVDQIGKIQDYPSLSQITGMLGNALGYRHQDFELLEKLQNRMIYTVIRLKMGEKITDYQTVDLGQSFLVDTGWTTSGKIEPRKGGSSTGTQIRFRDFWADSAYLVGLRLRDDDFPDSSALQSALEMPRRPLFIGRKPCIPSRRLFEKVVEGNSSLDAVKKYLSSQLEVSGSFEFWSSEEGIKESSEMLMVTDERDWKNQIHVGQRKLHHGVVEIEAIS